MVELKLTEDPRPWLHLIPVCDNVDSSVKADQLGEATHKSETEEHTSLLVTSSRNLALLLKLFGKLILQSLQRGFCSRRVGLH